MTEKPTLIAETLASRGQVYGSFKDNSQSTQTLMDVVMSCKKRPLEKFELEALHMIMHKVSRIIVGHKTKKDNWHDIAGYAKLAEDLTEDQ